MFDMLHNLVHMRATCFHMLKIASDGNFYLLFGKLASAEFDPWLLQDSEANRNHNLSFYKLALYPGVLSLIPSSSSLSGETLSHGPVSI